MSQTAWTLPPMRLQCPNCDAEYEVDTAAIPHEGRDVQCSNCGHGWFQSHPDFEADYEVESSLYDPPPALPQGADVAAGPIPKHELDPAAQQILREEVALEAAKRAAERPSTAQTSAALATQDEQAFEDELDAMVADTPAQVVEAHPDDGPAQGATAAAGQSDTSGDQRSADMVGDNTGDDFEADLDAERLAAEPLPRVTARRVARLKGEREIAASLPEQSAPAQSAAKPTTAAQGFAPVDDTIADSDLRAEMANAKTAGKSGGKFGRRAGIYAALLPALAAAASYVLSPEIVGALPQLAGPMEKYVSFINILRDGLQGAVPQISSLATGVFESLTAWVAAQGWF